MAISLPFKEGGSDASQFNASQFKSAVGKSEFKSLFAGRETLRSALFVDTHGHGRAAEMATRYVQWLDSMKLEPGKRPQVLCLTGGMHAYCNAQCFGRVVLNTPNPFGEFFLYLVDCLKKLRVGVC